ncbi:MAG: hypothetical protein ACUVR4_05700 [Anaerolineae bacterium]
MGQRAATARPRADLFAYPALALATLAVLWPLGLTNRIPAGVDAFTYFAPYWDYRMAAFRAGQVPLWNPYLFLGVPFLANPQAAVLYPLHWPLSWLTPEQALVWSALLHAWLAAGFTYTLGRRSFELSPSAAWLAGAVFGLGGYMLARVENINQLNALAWLPAMLWLYDETARGRNWRHALRWGSGLTVAVALCLLAGHTQSFFIAMVGLGLYAAVGLTGAGRRNLVGRLRPLLAVVPAALVAAAQLLPTLELSGLGLRTGGLAYRQAVSFSLRPRLLAQTFLTPFGGGLAEAFGSEGYAEFVGYAGVGTLILAGLAVVRSRQASRTGRSAKTSLNEPGESGRGPALILAPVAMAAAGVLLALGAYNPLYYLLWRFVPGFDLFRGPARWLALFALAVALLAGLGLDTLGQPGPQKRTRGLEAKHHTKANRRAKTMAALSGLAAISALIASQQPPQPIALVGWAGAGATAGFWVGLGRRRPNLARWGLIALALGELWLGSRALPFAQATAPMAAGLRNAPAALLAATAGQPAAGRDRFLSLSDIRYDPGDLAELRSLQADRLAPDAIERLVRAAKQVEVIAPNLPLRFRLPAVDGYDGGVLPLGRYVKLQGLFLPPETLIPDGRLREQLAQVPADRLLDLTGVRFVITDKQRDLWADDVYYDLELAAALPPGAALKLDLSAYPAFSATAVGVVLTGPNLGQDALQAVLTVVGPTGEASELSFSPEAGDAATPQPTVVRLPQPLVPKTLVVRNAGEGPLTLRGLSLIDTRTAAHTSIAVSPRGDVRRIHTGDVKIYERTSAPGRAWLVHGIRPAADDETALALLADPAFDPRATAVVAGWDLAPRPDAPAGPDEQAIVVAFQEEQAVLHVRATAPALLVVADTWYPGWTATVDGRPAELWRVNLLMRGILVDAGEHQVTLRYRPSTWLIGRALSLAGLALLGLGLVATVFPSREQKCIIEAT